MEYTIYKICSKNGEIKDCYVGSTENFKERRWNHKSHCNNSFDDAYNYKVYRFIRDNGGWDNWKFEILESGKCENKPERHKIERSWVEKLNATLNGVIPSRTLKEGKKEYYEKNKDKIKESSREYYEKNRDKKLEYWNQKVPCDECGTVMNRSSLTRHKKRKHPK